MKVMIPMIECSKLSKAYLNQLVIDEFSYEFKDAGFYLLLGESGSGKTTLLNILAGLTPFDGGIITWNDLCYTEQVDNSVIQDSFAYITQDAFFVDFLSIGDNLRLIDSNESKILSTLARFGLANKINHFPSTLISFVLGMLVLSALLVNSMFQKVRVTSWYENLIATRDLL